MKVLVFGGRDYVDADHRLSNALTKLTPRIIAHGMCKTGADAVAEAWSQRPSNQHVACVRYPANWAQLGKSAGPLRNEAMVRDFCPDVALGVAGGKGTRDCADRLRKYGIPILWVDQSIITKRGVVTTCHDRGEKTGVVVGGLEEYGGPAMGIPEWDEHGNFKPVRPSVEPDGW